jgi:hypothetical protein
MAVQIAEERARERIMKWSGDWNCGWSGMDGNGEGWLRDGDEVEN